MKRKTKKSIKRLSLKKKKKIRRYTRRFYHNPYFGGTLIPTDGSHHIGKSATITITPSNLYKSKFKSNIRVDGSSTDIDETLASMVKSVSEPMIFQRPIYSKKIVVDLPKGIH